MKRKAYVMFSCMVILAVVSVFCFIDNSTVAGILFASSAVAFLGCAIAFLFKK